MKNISRNPSEKQMFCELNFLGDFSGKTCFSTIEMRTETTLGFLKRSGEKVLTEEKIQHKNFPSECFVLFFQTWFFFLLKKKLLKITKKKQKKVFFKWIIFQKTFVASVLSYVFPEKRKKKNFVPTRKNFLRLKL